MMSCVFERDEQGWVVHVLPLAGYFFAGFTLIVGFLAFFMMPLFDGRSGSEVIGEWLTAGDDTVVVPLGDPPEGNSSWWVYPELEPYQIYAAPQINWSKFWPVFKDHALWSLEGSLDGETWYEEIPGTGVNLTTDVLNVGVEYINDSSRKVTCDFTAIDPPGPSTAAFYRFSFAIDYRVREFVNRSGMYEYTLTYEVDNASFDLVFNWSDYVHSPLAAHSHVRHGIVSIDGYDYFYFRVISDNPVEAGTFVELDPNYEVYTGSIVYLTYTNSRKLCRQSNSTLWATFVTDLDVYVAFSEDAGVTWTTRLIYGDAGSVAPTMAVDSNDVVHLVFHSYKNDANDYQLEYTNSTDWDTITQIRDEDKMHTYASLAVDSNDNLHVVYEKGEEGASNDDQVAYISSMDNGGSWGTEDILTNEANNGDDAWFPAIAINSTDGLHVVFSREDGVGGYDAIYHMSSSDYGNSWSAWDGDVVRSHTENVLYPSLAILDNDALSVASRGATAATLHASINTGGGWSTTITDTSTLYACTSVVDNDTIYNIYEETTLNDILENHLPSEGAWSDEVVILVGTYSTVISISSQYPVIDGAKTNRPATGYAFITSGNSNLTYYASSDLTWDTGGEPGPEWHNVITTINGSYSNTTTFQTIISTINGSYSNSTAFKTVIDTINGSYSNTTVFQTVISTINGSYSNTTAAIDWNTVINTINGSYSNTTTWATIIDTINGSYSNSTDWETIDNTINGSYSNNTQTWNTVDNTINGSYSNTSTTTPAGVNITITSEYPNNNSILFALQPTVYFTLDHTGGLPMNYTIYTGNSSVNCTHKLATGSLVYDGTYQYVNYYNASEYDTFYWRVNVTDDVGNSTSETFLFSTRLSGGGGMGDNGMAAVGLCGIIGIIGFIGYIRRRRE